MEDALGTAGTLSLTAVVLVWGLWLASRAGAWRVWRVLPLAVLPCVATPLVLADLLADHLLSDVANGALLTFALMVSVGTLVHAARVPKLEGD